MFYICNSAKKEKGRRKKVNSLLNLTCKNRNFHEDLFHMWCRAPPVVQMYNNHDSFKVWKLKFLKFKPHWKPKGEMFLVTFYSYFDRLSKTKKKKKKERERSRVQTVREEQKKVLIREKQQRQGKGKGKGGGVV